jgi:GlpG protein
LLQIASLDEQGRFDRQAGLAQIRQGQVWRLVTPIFLHASWRTGFGIFHLLFNLFWLQDLGTQIEWRRGSLRFLWLVLSIAVASNLAQYALSGPSFGGMSGVVYGLFGYVWIKSRYDPAAQLGIWPQTVQVMLAWFVVCWLCMAAEVANWAHSAGLLTGMALAVIPVWLRKARRTKNRRLR